jgi:anti-sigma regulatory factor (Ser/Thr protein kinase)
MVECHRHEALLNLAFKDAPDFELLCPYDTTALSPDVIAHAHHTHPVLAEGDVRYESADYQADAIPGAFCHPLPKSPPSAEEFTFDHASLPAIRQLVLERARDAHVEQPRAGDFMTAVNEIATNSIRHGGGSGSLRMWRAGDTLVCDITDGGRIEDPLIGRRRPDPHQPGGFGVWIANQVCDLVQVRSSPAGSAIRLHLRRR